MPVLPPLHRRRPEPAANRSPARDRREAVLLVGAQFILVGLVTALPRRHDWPVSKAARRTAAATGVAGVAIAVLAAGSLGRGLTPAPLPSARAELCTGGLYRHVRHPLYSGLLLAAAARTAVGGNRYGIGVLGLLGALLRYKAGSEEVYLRECFPGYAEYAARTPRFVPTAGGRAGR